MIPLRKNLSQKFQNNFYLRRTTVGGPESLRSVRNPGYPKGKTNKEKMLFCCFVPVGAVKIGNPGGFYETEYSS